MSLDYFLTLALHKGPDLEVSDERIIPRKNSIAYCYDYEHSTHHASKITLQLNYNILLYFLKDALCITGIQVFRMKGSLIKE